MNSESVRAARRLLGAMFCAGAALLFAAEQAMAAPVAVSPYKLITFNGVPPMGMLPNGTTGQVNQPDDLAITADGKNLWVGYGNGAATDGSKGGGNLVEYDIASGTVLQNIAIPGHIDGVKINPTTGDIWATENEDLNPTIAIVSAKTGKFKTPTTFSTTSVTGGLDDLVFSGPDSENVFIVASSQTPTDLTKPVIIQVSPKPKKAITSVQTVLTGSPAHVWNVVTNEDETTDQVTDPDSMTLDPAGELVLDNRKDLDDSLYIVRDPSAPKPVLRVPLTLAGAPVEVNDTIFTTSATTGGASTAGTVFITDTTANAIYLLTKPYFPSNEVYTAANVENDVGLVDLNTGVVTPVAAGFLGVHGLAFSPISVGISAPVEGGQ
jgi:hypothetical protein